MALSLPSRPANPQLRRALLAGLTAPAAGLGLARIAWAEAQTHPDQTNCLEAGLALGFALNRAERPAAALSHLREIEPRLAQAGLTAEHAICRWQIGVAMRILRTQAGMLSYLESAHEALVRADLLLEATLCLRDVAIACNGVGDWERSARHTAEARAWLEARGLLADAATFAVTESAQLRRRGRFEAALAILRQAENVFTAEGLPVEQAAARLYQASIYTAQFDTERAIPQLQSVLATFEDLDLPLRQAMTWTELGSNAQSRANLAEAEAAFAASARLHAQLQTRADQAHALINLSVVRHDQGELVEACQQFAEAQVVCHELGDRVGEALCTLNIGATESALGRYGSALRRLEAARGGLAAIGATEYIPITHHNLGRTWLELGDEALARKHLQQAVAGYQAIGANFGAARSLVRLGLIEAEAGRFEAALQLVDQARNTAVATRAAGYLAVCDQLAGEIQLRAGNVAAGLADLANAEAAFTRLGMPINALGAAITQAEALALLGQTETAEARGAATFQQTAAALPDLAFRCASGLAQVAEQRGQPGQALTWHRRAVDALRTVRSSLQHELLVDAFLSRRMSAVHKAIECALEAGQTELALQFVEESRAQLFAQRRGPRPAAGKPEDDEGQRLRRDMAEIRRKLSGSLEAESSWSILRPATAAQAELLAQLDQKARAYQAHGALSMNAGRAATEAIEFDLAALRAALNASQPRGWLCLAYYWLKDKLLTFVIDDREVTVTRTSLNPLERLALELCTAPEQDRRRAIYGGVSGRADGAGDAQAGDGQASRRYRELLYQLLIPAAIRSRLAPDRLLLIVPAGRLHALPFQALVQGHRYLCQQAVLAVAPSLAGPRTAERDRQPVSPALVVAIDDFGGDQPRLPFAQREAQVVAACLPDARVLMNEQATSAGLRAELAAHDQEPFAVLHFATHAVFEAGYGRLSRLVLSGGDLLADEIEAANVPARLVVLAACQSALGQVHSGEEVVGLSQAFFSAGAHSVLSALWSVNDDDSPRFMGDFYSAYAGQNLAPPAALADTQRRWIEAGRPASTWAAYHVLGAA